MIITKQYRFVQMIAAQIKKTNQLASGLLAVYALIQIVLVTFLWINHIKFPLNLEAMELTVLQHLKRVIEGLPLYPEPSSDFIALAYNPLYYFLSVPFAWIFGANLFTLRLVSILGMIGIGVVIFLALRRYTLSNWWSLIGVGLFAAAYRVMDAYLDNAHRDSWLIFTILLGCYLIDRKDSRISNRLGMFSLLLAFWFKQQGAFFVIAAVLYLTWRDGLRKAIAPWILTIALGPGLYLGMPDWLLGSHFRYFTWQVPRQWVEPTRHHELVQLVKLVLSAYSILFVISCGTWIQAVLRSRNTLNVWYFMLPIALISGITSALLPGSNNNVYIPMGVWIIMVGVLGLKQLTDHYPLLKQRDLHLILLSLSFAFLLYNPLSLVASPQAAAAYQDLTSYLKSINGTVYAPWLGQLQDSYKFSPSVHWVPLEDIIRGPGVNEQNHPTVRRMLEPVLKPKGKAYILHNYPLENDGLLAFLNDNYVLDTDLGERFKPLQTLPRQIYLKWPRYLYRYVPEKSE